MSAPPRWSLITQALASGSLSRVTSPWTVLGGNWVVLVTRTPPTRSSRMGGCGRPSASRMPSSTIASAARLSSTIRRPKDYHLPHSLRVRRRPRVGAQLVRAHLVPVRPLGVGIDVLLGAPRLAHQQQGARLVQDEGALHVAVGFVPAEAVR